MVCVIPAVSPPLRLDTSVIVSCRRTSPRVTGTPIIVPPRHPHAFTRRNAPSWHTPLRACSHVPPSECLPCIRPCRLTAPSGALPPTSGNTGGTSLPSQPSAPYNGTATPSSSAGAPPPPPPTPSHGKPPTAAATVRIGRSASRLCKFADAKGVTHTDHKLNDELWVGQKHCKIADLMQAFPRLCWAPMMSHLRGVARFTVCMQSANKGHTAADCHSGAHAYPADYRATIKPLFQP